MDVHTIGGGAKSGRLVAMKSLTAGIATMKQRPVRRMTPSDTKLFGIILRRLFAQFATPSREFSKLVRLAEFAWENTSAASAISLMMMVGGKDNFFHCDRCGCCYAKILENKHVCVENSMEHNCPVCFEVHVSHMLQICLGHVLALATAWSRGSRNTSARSIPKQDGVDSLLWLWRE